MRNMRIKMFGLALVAVFAMGAVASATASALPTLPQLVNKEEKPLVKTGFTGTSGASKFETKSGESVKCKADTIKGKITGLSTDEAEIKFTGCTAVSGLLKCKSKGASSGEIVLKIASTLVWLNESKEEPGEDFYLPALLTIECTGMASETLEVEGSTLCPTTKALSKTATIKCKETKGVQEWTEYEMEGKKFLDITKTKGSGAKTFPFEQSALEDEDTLTFEEEVKII